VVELDEPGRGADALLGAIQRARGEQGVRSLDEGQRELGEAAREHAALLLALRLDLRGVQQRVGVGARHLDMKMGPDPAGLARRRGGSSEHALRGHEHFRDVGGDDGLAYQGEGLPEARRRLARPEDGREAPLIVDRDQRSVALDEPAAGVAGVARLERGGDVPEEGLP
jgi:hypothetical protein